MSDFSLVTDLAVQHVFVSLQVLIGPVAQDGFVSFAIVLLLSAALILAIEVDGLVVLALAFEVEVVGNDFTDL